MIDDTFETARFGTNTQSEVQQPSNMSQLFIEDVENASGSSSDRSRAMSGAGAQLSVRSGNSARYSA